MSLARQNLESTEASPNSDTPTKPEAEPEAAASTPSAATRPTRIADDGPSVVPIVAFGAMLDVGALPSAALGVEALVGLEWPSVDLWAIGGLTTQQEFEFETGSGKFDLLFGGASACYSPERSTWELAGCLTGEVGRIHGIGANVENAREGSSLWVAVVAAARLRLRPVPRRWGLFVEAGAVVPLARRPFELTEVGIVHQPAAVGLRSLAGIELGFR
jgi:hypothetical protein